MFSIRTCSPSQALTENDVISCTIERQRGDDGEVTISWGVFQSLGGGEVEALQDFVNSKGTVTFPAGERLKVRGQGNQIIKMRLESKLQGQDIIQKNK